MARRTPTAAAEAALTAAVERSAHLRAELTAAEADRDAAVVALRAEGRTLAELAARAQLSRPGVLKLLRRHEAAT